MITEIGKLILDCLKLAPRYFVAIGIVAGLILFGPDAFVKRCGPSEFAQNYRSTLGIVFISSIALGCAGIAHWLSRIVQHRLRNRQMRQHITQRLHGLTEDEKQILRFYIGKQTRANTLRIDDGVVKELEAEGIIHRSSSLGSMLDGFAYNISDIAWDYLHKHKDLLLGTTNTYRTDKSEYW